MKKYIPLLGIAGIAATVGFYLHYNQTEETKPEEGKREYQPQVPQTKNSSPPYQKSQKKEKNEHKKPVQNKTSKTYPSAPKQTSQKTLPQNSPPSRPSSSPTLEQTLNDEEQKEEFWYDLPADKRYFKTVSEIEPCFNGALDARDYKAAESYLTSFQEITSPQEYDRLKKGLLYTITTNYNEYLNDVVEHCNQYDSNSVLRKVLWMNVFANAHPDVFPIPDQNAKSYLDIAGLFKKGILALDAIKYCAEKRL